MPLYALYMFSWSQTGESVLSVSRLSSLCSRTARSPQSTLAAPLPLSQCLSSRVYTSLFRFGFPLYIFCWKNHAIIILKGPSGNAAWHAVRTLKCSRQKSVRKYTTSDVKPWDFGFECWRHYNAAQARAHVLLFVLHNILDTVHFDLTVSPQWLFNDGWCREDLKASHRC